MCSYIKDRPKAHYLLNNLTHFPLRRDNPAPIMHKLITITVLIAVLALGAESFRVPRQAEDEEMGTVTTVMDTLKSYYDQGLNTASGYLDSIKGFKLEEKAKSLIAETTQAVRTYAGIFQDQLYHIVYPQDSA